MKAEASFQRAYLVQLIDFAFQGMWIEGIQNPGLSASVTDKLHDFK